MKVIFVDDVPNVAKVGQTKDVANGYARNYLFPKGLALEASGKNVRELEHKKRQLAQKKEKIRQEMLSFAEKLNGVTLSMRRKVSEDDKLYGSVSGTDIAKALEDKGHAVERKAISLDQPIKQLGEYSVVIRVDAQINATIRVVIEKEE